MHTKNYGKKLEKATREGGGLLSQMLEEEREEQRKEAIKKIKAAVKIIQESPEGVKIGIRMILEEIKQAPLTNENMDEIIKEFE